MTRRGVIAGTMPQEVLLPLPAADPWAASAAQLVSSLRLLAFAARPGLQSSRPQAPSSRAGQDADDDDAQRLQALVSLAKAGDAEAFAVLYRRYVDVVYRYVYVRTGNQHVAEDLTSETFIRALRRLDTFSWQGKDIAAWFVTIARNITIDYTKSARFRMEITTASFVEPDAPAGSAPEDEVIERSRNERLLDHVRALKPEQAECLVLRFIQDLSIAETAAVMGRTEGAVKQLQLRALRALQRNIAEEAL